MRRTLLALVILAGCGSGHLAGNKYGDRNRAAYDTQATKGTSDLRYDTEDAKITLDAQRGTANKAGSPGGAAPSMGTGGGSSGSSRSHGDIVQPIRLEGIVK